MADLYFVVVETLAILHSLARTSSLTATTPWAFFATHLSQSFPDESRVATQCILKEGVKITTTVMESNKFECWREKGQKNERKHTLTKTPFPHSQWNAFVVQTKKFDKLKPVTTYSTCPFSGVQMGIFYELKSYLDCASVQLGSHIRLFFAMKS